MTRAFFWALAIAATAVAAWFAPSDPGDTVVQPAHGNRPADEAARPRVAATSVASIGVVRARSPDVGEIPPVFGLAAWMEKPVPVAATALPTQAAHAPLQQAASEPPPLPFKVLGNMTDEGKPTVFLQFNDQNLAVRAGDNIAGQYQVEKVDELGMTLLHLPTQQRQSLSLASAR